MKTDKEINITFFFNEGELMEKSDGNYKTICPDCGLQGGRTEGMIIFPETNTWFCHSSGKHGGILELIALQNKIIKCIDCCETGEKRRVLENEQYKETIDILKNKYTEEDFFQITALMKLKHSIELPNNGKLISKFASELANRLRREYIFFYRSDTKDIVEIGKIKHQNKECEYKGFVSVNANRFITLIERYFTPWTKIYTKKGELIINKSMPQSTANIVLVSDDFMDNMPVINRIFTIQQPILYNNELTFPKTGYDERFGSWLSHNSPKITHPDLSLEESKKIINLIFSEFCFQSKQDKTNAIAAFITPFIRGLYSKFNIRTPVMIYEANRERAGKDYLAGLTGLLYEGVALEESPISNSEKGHNSNDELRKKILSSMIVGRKRLHFANNKGHLNNAVFEAITTAAKFSDRLLGTNKTAEFDNEIEFSLSGNLGMTLTPDLANRSRFIKLFLDIEDANERRFQNPHLHSWLLENRDMVLSAIYGLVKHWIVNNSPKGSIPFASYPEWANVCGGIMETAGLGNPCIKDKEMLGIASDSETSDMKMLFELCHESKPDTWMKKHDIRDLIINSPEDVFGYINWENKSDQTKFALKFDKFVGRILSDIKLVVKDKDIRRKSRWEYMFVKQSRNDNGNVGNNGNIRPSVESPIENIYIESGGVPQKIPMLPMLPSTKNDVISDREIQFWDAKECKDIVSECSKEDVLQFFKDNPGASYKEMYDKLGIGSFKFRNKLIMGDEL